MNQTQLKYRTSDSKILCLQDLPLSIYCVDKEYHRELEYLWEVLGSFGLASSKSLVVLSILRKNILMEMW